MTGAAGLDPIGPRSNALQHLRRLSGRRRARLDAGQFVVDGPRLVHEALASAIEVVEVYAEPGADAGVVDAARAAGVPVVAVRAGALAKVTDPVTPQGVAALARRPAVPWPPSRPLRGLVLVLVGVADPGNAGTLVRVAEATGASAVVSCADAVDPWSPKCVRASAGSVFRVPVHEAADALDCMRSLHEAGMTTVATTLAVDAAGTDAAVSSLDDADLRGDVALLLGNEAHGLPDEAVAAAALRLRIPMAGRVESLNVAMAGTVLAFESARQRRVSEAGASEEAVWS